MFRNFEKLFYQIKTTLLNSADLKRLVFYNTSDALSLVEPTYEEASISIYTKPIIYVYDDSPEFGISSFISIGLIEGLGLDGSLQASIKITVACDRQIWNINNERIRPLAISSIIVDTLDNKKFDVAGKLIWRVVTEVFFNNDLVGYTMLFDITDEKGDVVNEF